MHNLPMSSACEQAPFEFVARTFVPPPQPLSWDSLADKYPQLDALYATAFTLGEYDWPGWERRVKSPLKRILSPGTEEFDLAERALLAAFERPRGAGRKRRG